MVLRCSKCGGYVGRDADVFCQLSGIEALCASCLDASRPQEWRARESCACDYCKAPGWRFMTMLAPMSSRTKTRKRERPHYTQTLCLDCAQAMLDLGAACREVQRAK